jgi:hypothetical protein
MLDLMHMGNEFGTQPTKENVVWLAKMAEEEHL